MRNLIVLLLAVLTAPAAMAVELARHVDRDHNFSTTTPLDWKWSSAPADEAKQGVGGAVLVAGSPTGTRFSVSVTGVGQFRLTDEWMMGMLRELERGGAAGQAYRIEEFRYVRRGSPIVSSYTFSYTKRASDGSAVFVDGYVAATNRIYTLQYASRRREEIVDFVRFVDSFQIADKFEALRGTSTVPGARGMSSQVSAPMQAPLGIQLGPNASAGATH